MNTVAGASLAEAAPPSPVAARPVLEGVGIDRRWVGRLAALAGFHPTVGWCAVDRDAVIGGLELPAKTLPQNVASTALVTPLYNAHDRHLLFRRRTGLDLVVHASALEEACAATAMAAGVPDGNKGTAQAARLLHQAVGRALRRVAWQHLIADTAPATEQGLAAFLMVGAGAAAACLPDAAIAPAWAKYAAVAAGVSGVQAAVRAVSHYFLEAESRQLHSLLPLWYAERFIAVAALSRLRPLAVPLTPGRAA